MKNVLKSCAIILLVSACAPSLPKTSYSNIKEIDKKNYLVTVNQQGLPTTARAAAVNHIQTKKRIVTKFCGENNGEAFRIDEKGKKLSEEQVLTRLRISILLGNCAKCAKSAKTSAPYLVQCNSASSLPS